MPTFSNSFYLSLYLLNHMSVMKIWIRPSQLTFHACPLHKPCYLILDINLMLRFALLCCATRSDSRRLLLILQGMLCCQFPLSNFSTASNTAPSTQRMWKALSRTYNGTEIIESNHLFLLGFIQQHGSHKEVLGRGLVLFNGQYYCTLVYKG